MAQTGTSRREFLSVATTAGLAAGASRLLRAETSNQPQLNASADHVRLATIGLGGQGLYDTRTALSVPGVELIGVADVYDGRLVHAKELFGASLVTTRDYREILARPDVDAVIVATPDHWHRQITADAMIAGKDVYLEKPMVRSPAEGRQLIDVERQTGRILQVGSQRVSSILYEKARQLIAERAIGDLILVESWWDRNSAIGAWQYTIPPDASPETVDWDRFLGTAPARPFEAMRLFRWRNYRDYGTGVAGDLFVHLFSGMHYILGATGPTRIFASGGIRHWHDGRDVPDVLLGIYDYPETSAHPAFNLFLRVNFADGSGGGSGFRFVGSEGVITVGDRVEMARRPRPEAPGLTVETFPSAMQEEIREAYDARYPDVGRTLQPEHSQVFVAPRGYSDSFDHLQNFFGSVRSRAPVIEDATFGLRAAGPAVLSNVSQEESRPIIWNPETMDEG
jgi:predicted dehydrogenase